MSQLIVIVCETTRVSREDVEKIVSALQQQVEYDLRPAWGIARVTVRLLAIKEQIATGAWPIFVRDTSDIPGAAGYHEDPEGDDPQGQVFVDSCVGVLQGPDCLAVDLSHELLELLIDPTADRSVSLFEESGDTLSFEVCDPVQADTYEINGVTVSDFVYPMYFSPVCPASGWRLDHLDLIKQPFDIRPGGYQSRIKKNGTSYDIGAKKPARRASAGRSKNLQAVALRRLQASPTT